MKKEDFCLLAFDDPCFRTRTGQIVYAEYEDDGVHLRWGMNQNTPVSIITAPNGGYKTTFLRLCAGEYLSGSFHFIYCHKNGYALCSRRGKGHKTTLLGNGETTYEAIERAIQKHNDILGIGRLTIEELASQRTEKGVADELWRSQPIGLYLDHEGLCSYSRHWEMDSDGSFRLSAIQTDNDYISIPPSDWEEIRKIFFDLTRIYDPSWKETFDFIKKPWWSEDGTPLCDFASRGTGKLINLLVMIVSSRYSHLFIDELENSLHIAQQEELTNIIESLAEKYGQQIIYATHSPSMIAHLDHCLIERLK